MSATHPKLRALTGTTPDYNFAFLDEITKREIRRSLLKAVAIPGYQVPFGSREMPIARGWGTGGLQITLSLVGPDDTVKVIDQGSDAALNAANIRRLVTRTAPQVRTTTETGTASIIQSRHRIPEESLRADQLLVLQVPQPEPLRYVEPLETVTREMHAAGDYASIWVSIYEDIVRDGEASQSTGYPVFVNDRYVMSPSPIPRFDVPKLHRAPYLTLIGAGRESRVYAVPPHTTVMPLAFEDHPFRIEDFTGKHCARCGSTDTYLDEIVLGNGRFIYTCSDTAFCKQRQTMPQNVQPR